MNLLFDTELARKYISSSQKIRVLSESWVKNQVYCPNCGQDEIDGHISNKPVADFFCSNCSEDYELKSSKSTFGTKIVDGAYSTMIERLGSITNPNFFLLRYSLVDLSVQDFIVIPKHFFVPKIIEKRPALTLTARRAGWIGCNILISHIPTSGKVYIVRNKEIQTKKSVTDEWQKTLFLRQERDAELRGWTLDIMRCVDGLDQKGFMLADVYGCEQELEKLHPSNKHIRDKIRQQLQILRDNNYIEFLGRGKYRIL